MKRIIIGIAAAILLVGFCITGVYAQGSYSLPEAIKFEHGSVSFDKTSANEGDNVTVTATAEAGYELGALIISGEVVLATGAASTTDEYYGNTQYDYTLQMPAASITESSVKAYFDPAYQINVNTIHNFDGGVSGTSSPNSKALFDGIVNTSAVTNGANMTYNTPDDLILDAGEGKSFILSEIIAYSQTDVTQKPHLRIHLSDDLDNIGSVNAVVFETGGAANSNYTAINSTGDSFRQVFTADSDLSGRYMKIKYQDKSVKLSEIKIYVKDIMLNARQQYTDGMTLYAGRHNKIEGFCYGMDENEDVYFHLINETTNEIVNTQAENFGGQREWSILLDPITDTENSYTLMAVCGEEKWIEIKHIHFSYDLPLMRLENSD